MKITELRLSKLFSAEATTGSTSKNPHKKDLVTKAGGSVSHWLFPFLVFAFCWYMFFQVSSSVFEFLDILDYEEMEVL